MHFKYSKLAVLLSIFVASEAFCASLNFLCITNNNAQNCAVGESQLTVDVSDYGNNQVLFSVNNTGSSLSVVKGIYFDDGTLLDIAHLIDQEDDLGFFGVDFSTGNPFSIELPGSTAIDPEFITTAGFLTSAEVPIYENGINAGEWLGIVFDLQYMKDFSSVIDDLATGELRIGLHVLGFDEGGSESFVNATVVPLPSAFLLMLSSLGALLFARGRSLG